MREHIDHATRRRAVAAARGAEPFDTLLTGGQVIDVITGEIRPHDVGLVGPLISSVHPSGTRSDGRIVDVSDRYISPGFIDIHLHFESSFLTPGGYAEAVVPRGTTTAYADPHELANVAGVEGVEYAIAASRDIPLRMIWQASSCVPPTPGSEQSGAELDNEDIKWMLELKEVDGLGEMMDTEGVLDDDSRATRIVQQALEHNRLVNGHAAGLGGQHLQAYMNAGLDSDHEIYDVTDGMEKLRAGMTIELRAGMEFEMQGGRHERFANIIRAVSDLPILPASVAAASDDVMASSLLGEGGIDRFIRLAIRAGLDPVAAFRIATYHGALRLSRLDLGAVAAGRLADIVVLTDLHQVEVERVFFGGDEVARNGQMLVDVARSTSKSMLLNTMHVSRVDSEDLRLRSPIDHGTWKAPIIVGSYERPEWGTVDLEVSAGTPVLPDNCVVQAAIHRYGRRPHPRPELALLADRGRWNGAIATSFAHDTHNLVVFGRNPTEMALAANTVIEAGGGIAVVQHDRVRALLELPIGGILTDEPPQEVALVLDRVSDAALDVVTGWEPNEHPMWQVTGSSLVCTPGPHLGDMGIVEGPVASDPTW